MEKGTLFNLSKYEIWFLLSQNPPTSIIGFKNPVEGYLAEDLFPLIQETSNSLLNKDFIFIDQDHTIKIKDDLNKILRVAIEATHTLLVAYKINTDKIETVRSFNFHRGKIVLLQEDVNGSYILLEMDNDEDLVSLITEPFIKKMFWAPDSPAFQISEEDITFVHHAVEKLNYGEAKALLGKAQGDEYSKTHFFETLKSPNIKFSFLAFKNWKNSQMNHMNGFSIIADDHYIWLLDFVNLVDRTVNVSKTTIKELKMKVASIVSSLLRE